MTRFGFQYLQEALTAYGTKVISRGGRSKKPERGTGRRLITSLLALREDLWETGSKKTINAIKEEFHHG